MLQKRNKSMSNTNTTVDFEIKRSDVMTEVAKTTAYLGKNSDPESFENIYTNPEDFKMLSRFWDESQSLVCSSVCRFLIEDKMDNNVYTLRLNLSKSFNVGLKPSMQKSLFSFFVSNICAKWFGFMSKEDSTLYAAEASAFLEDFKRKACSKVNLSRPTYQ